MLNIKTWESGEASIHRILIADFVSLFLGVARYLKSRCDTHHDTSLMLRLIIDYQVKIKEA